MPLSRPVCRLSAACLPPVCRLSAEALAQAESLGAGRKPWRRQKALAQAESLGAGRKPWRRQKALAQTESLGAGRGEGLPCGVSSATPQGKGGRRLREPLARRGVNPSTDSTGSPQASSG